jgi:hypothetical protein
MTERILRCVIKGCGREQVTRGLCSSCYQAARRLIRDGGVETEKKLMDAGLLLPSSYTPRTSAFTTAAKKAGVL